MGLTNEGTRGKRKGEKPGISFRHEKHFRLYKKNKKGTLIKAVLSEVCIAFILIKREN